jgi:hypothetical protein
MEKAGLQKVLSMLLSELPEDAQRLLFFLLRLFDHLPQSVALFDVYLLRLQVYAGSERLNHWQDGPVAFLSFDVRDHLLPIVLQ